MSNLVLYRKYRPQKFAEIVGQELVVKTISNALSSGLVSHAYIFSGPRGAGKTTIARLLAKSLNCHNRKEGSFEPCNRCDSCREIMEGRSLDLIELDAASNRGIDEIRELKENVRFAPVKEKYKVFILDEAHQLTKEAVNALLKVLEEPPAHAVFIMATTEIHKMIPTIISRCQRFDFRKLTMDEIVKRLEYLCKMENAKADKSALEMIALNSGGAVRDAESLLDQALTFSGEAASITADGIKDLLGIVSTGFVSQFVDFLAEKNAEEAVKFLNSSLDKGYDCQEFAKATIGYLRQAILLKINPDHMNPVILGLTVEEQAKLKAQTTRFSSAELSKMITLFMEAEGNMKFSPIPQLPFELAIIDITVKEG